MENAGKIFTRLSVPTDSFHTESFEPAEEDPQSDFINDDAKTYEIEFTKSQRSVAANVGVTVLKAAKEQKVRIQTSCGKGICGTCRVKLLSGTVEINHLGGIKQREIDQGYILACCSHPTSDIVIDK